MLKNKLLLFFLLCISLFSAEIDVKLFENADKENYYDEIKKSIDYASNKGMRSEEIIKDEIMQLSRLREATSSKIKIDKYDVKILKNEKITTENYYNAINTLALLTYKQEQNFSTVSEIQSKLLLLKKSIERITEYEKPKLLSYQLQFAYYKIQQKNIKEKISLIQEHQEEIRDLLNNSLNSVECSDWDSISSKQISLDTKFEESVQKKVSQKLRLEKAVIEDSDKIEAIKREIEISTSPIFVYNERPMSFLSLSTSIVLLFFIIALGSIGIDMSSISLIAGALSIGVGFGLQTVVSNFIAGIILMFERTIRVGDTIEINDIVLGAVTDIRIRSTTVKTFDNIDIVVPNSSFIQNNVVDWTLEDKVRRLLIPFSVAFDTEVDDVKNAVLGALSASNLLYIKTKSMSLRSDFLILIYNALRANNISIPFPQLELHMKERV